MKWGKKGEMKRVMSERLNIGRKWGTEKEIRTVLTFKPSHSTLPSWSDWIWLPLVNTVRKKMEAWALKVNKIMRRELGSGVVWRVRKGDKERRAVEGRSFKYVLIISSTGVSGAATWKCRRWALFHISWRLIASKLRLPLTSTTTTGPLSSPPHSPPSSVNTIAMQPVHRP